MFLKKAIILWKKEREELPLFEPLDELLPVEASFKRTQVKS